MMVGARGPLLVLAGLLLVALLAVFALQLTGEDLGELWRDIGCRGRARRLPRAARPAALGCAAVRIRNRRRRPMARYQLVLSQADEATFEEVAAACEQLVQTLRESLTERLTGGPAVAGDRVLVRPAPPAAARPAPRR